MSGVDTSSVTFSPSLSSVTTTEDNQFILSFAGKNGNGVPRAFGSGGSSVLGDAVTTGSVTGGGNLAAGSAAIPVSGSQNLNWAASADGTLTVIVSPIPEPSSSMLLGIAGLSLILRRKRN